MLSAIRCFSSFTPRSPSLQSRLQRKAPLSISESALSQMKRLLDKKCLESPAPLGILIGVTRRGCNGLSYSLQYFYDKDTKRNPYDIHTQGGVTYAIEQKSLFALTGTHIDYIETALASEFRFNNPQSKGHCGCGESFNI